MKKIIYLATALAAMVLAGSCQKENLESTQASQTVTYTVQVPDAIATKAIGDGHSGVTKLIYEVYREAQLADLSADPIYEGNEIVTDGKATFALEFVKNQNFTVLFWAQNPGVDVYETSDLRKVTLKTALTANNEDMQVFAGSDKVVNCMSAAKGNVELVRPIAQVRVGTTSESLKIGNTSIELNTSDFNVSGLSNIYNVATKAVDTDKSKFEYDGKFEYTEETVPSGTFDVGSASYLFVAMNYVGFAPKEGANVDVEFNINTTEGEISHKVTNVPVKANYRTNIVGNLITAQSDYNVSIKPDWEEEEHTHGIVSVSTASDLQEAINVIPAGIEGNIKLEGNIDLGALAGLISTKADETPATPANGLLIPAGKALVLDLNGCTISQTVKQTAPYSMILNQGTLTIDDSKGNGKISYTDSQTYSVDNGYVSNTITNHGTLTIKGGTIENNSADNVALNGYPYAIDSRIGPNGNEVVTNIEGGTIQSNYSPLGVRAGSADKKVVANIAGGAIKGRVDFQMLTTTPALGELNISGGDFTLHGIKQYVLLVFGRGTETDARGLKANITGGTFNAGFSFSTGNPIGSNFNKKFISGGEFSFDPSEYLADGYFAELKDGKYVVYKAVAAIGETMYKSIEDAIAAVEESATIKVLCDAEMAAKTIAAGIEIVLDLNGCTISAVDNTQANYELIKNQGKLTVKNTSETSAKMTVKATINSGWSRYSAVIANTVGGNLTVEGDVVLEHLGGTDMAYGIDNLTNGKGTSAVTTIDGATVKSPYRAVRQFLNGIEATNELYVKAGSELRGDNKSIFFQDPSKNANTGKLVVNEGAKLYGDVYLFVTAGSTEWPVEVSIAESALADASEVISGNVPSGYAIIKDNETWKVVDNAIATAAEFKAFRSKINAGEKFSDKTAYLVADIDLNGEEWTPIGTKDSHFHGTFDGQGHTISNFKITQKHDGDNAQAALFGTVSLTTVFKNFNIDNIQVLYPADYNGDYYGAAVIGTFYGNVTLQNINVTKSTIQGNNKVAGLIAHDGSSSNVLIENCNVNGCTIETKNEEDGGNVGGLVGLFQNTKATVKNCSVTGCTINAINSSDSGKRGNALLVGGTIDSGTPDLYVKIENCKVADNTFKETGRFNYVSPYGDGTLVGGAREGSSYVIGKVEIDGVVYPNN